MGRTRGWDVKNLCVRTFQAETTASLQQSLFSLVQQKYQRKAGSKTNSGTLGIPWTAEEGQVSLSISEQPGIM